MNKEDLELVIELINEEDNIGDLRTICSYITERKNELELNHRFPELANTTFKELGFSTRVINSLGEEKYIRSGEPIIYVRDLLRYGSKEEAFKDLMANHRGFGVKAMKELDRFIVDKDLKFGLKYEKTNSNPVKKSIK